jgi:hypothetical protein
VHNVSSSLNLLTEHTASLEDNVGAVSTPTEFGKRGRDLIDGKGTGTGGGSTGTGTGKKSTDDCFSGENFDLKRKRSKSFSELLLPHFKEIVPITVRTHAPTFLPLFLSWIFFIGHSLDDWFLNILF